MNDLLSLYRQYDAESPAITEFSEGGSQLTYGDLVKSTLATRKELRQNGLEEQDRVVLVMPNGPLVAFTFLSCAPWVATAPLNPSYTAAEFKFYLEDLQPSLVMVQEGDDSPVLEVASNMGIRTTVASLPIGRDPSVGQNETEEPKIRAGDATALILHTSGTTSRPKMVPLSQDNLIASANNIAQTLALTPQDRCLNIMPLFHIHGLMAPILATISAGASVVCSPGFNALRFFSWLDEEKPTWYSAVPTMHQAILARSERNMEIAKSAKLRFIRSSSASLPPQVLHQLESTFNTRVVEAYAMTEAAHQMCSNPIAPAVRKPGTVGPAAGPEVRISDTQVLDFLDTGAEGEVVIRGKNVTQGYINNPEANAKDFIDGWFRTGDLGIMDAEGYVKITGRLKEIINRGGEKVAPLEVDEVLLDHPAVAQACTFALPHEKLGEDIAAIVVLKEDQSTTEREIQDFARQHLTSFKIPRTIVFKSEIPKGATGKVQRIGMAERIGLVTS